MREKRFLLPLLAIMAAVVFMGCATTKVENTELHQGAFQDLPRPSRVLVYDFAASPADVSRDRGIGSQIADSANDATPTEKQLEIGRKLSRQLSEELVKRIRKLGLPAERAMGEPPSGGNLLVIEGQFLDIDEGNRLSRMVIGLGTGASHVTTQVQVYDTAAQGSEPILTFSTSAVSGKKPGMAIMMPVSGAMRGASGVAMAGGVGVVSEKVGGGADDNVQRTAKKVADYLARFFIKRRWISSEVAEKHFWE